MWYRKNSHLYFFNKCWKVIREKINAEYNDVSFSKKENLNDKFEFISNGYSGSVVKTKI